MIKELVTLVVKQLVANAESVSVSEIKSDEKDLIEIPENVRSEIYFIFAKRIDDVLEAALLEGNPAKKLNTDVPRLEA